MATAFACAVFGAASLVRAAAPEKAVKVQNIRLVPASDDDKLPFATLAFDMLNDGTTRVTNIVLAISVTESRPSEQVEPSEHVVVGPFTIREKVVLQPGYSMEYELRLRNLAATNCSCKGRVEVVSVETVPESRPPR